MGPDKDLLVSQELDGTRCLHPARAPNARLIPKTLGTYYMTA